MPRTPTWIGMAVANLLFLFGALAASCGHGDPRVSPAAPVTPETMPKAPRSPAASFAVQQPRSPNFQVFDAALEELLAELPVVIEQAVDAGQSKAGVNASLVPGFMGTVGRLVNLRDDAYLPMRPAAMNSTRSVPCNECSDDFTSCLDDALDNFVDCVFDCGAFDGSCRRGCKDTWRSEKAACYDAHRACVRTCTPK